VIVLAGDIGGTHARLALADVEGAAVRVVREHRYPSRDYDGLAPIVREFLRETGAGPARACFGVACQLERDECRAANLPWTIRVAALGAAIGIPGAAVINDFSAAGHGIACLGPSDIVALQDGERDPTGPIALIGPGTGLGEGFLLWDGTRYRVHPSEGGHASFAPRGERQSGLAAYLRQRYGHASSERVLSGPGIADTYRYLASRDPAAESAEVRAAMAREDPAAVVTERALAGSDPLCVAALDLFVDALGSAAGDLALTVVATGGVYLAGGIAPRVVERLRGEGFLRAFREKGRKAGFLSTVPVHVIVNPDVGLLGAAVAAAGQGDR
jgi:glucokinase